MSGLATYLSMGGYAAYVWPAAAVTLIVLGAIWVASWRRARAADAALRRMENDIDSEGA